MRMKSNIEIFTLLSLLLINNSCSNTKQEYREPVFEKSIITNNNVLNKNFVFEMGTMEVVDTLIIYSGRTTISDKAFHLFSKNTGAYLSSFGNIGRGYGEITKSLGFSVDKLKRKMFVFDSGLDKTVSYSLDKVLAGEIDYAKEIKLPKIVTNVSSFKFFYLNNSFLATESYSGRFLICSESDSITSSDYYPLLDEPKKYKKVEHSYYLYTGCMSVKPSGDMFVHATRGGCIMEIWNYDGSSISPLIVKRFFKPNYLSFDRDANYPRVQRNDNDPYGISLLSCTNSYIYARYNNVPSKFTDKIAVFDWEGNPQRIYVVNEKIYSFTIDDDKKAYVLVENKNDNNIELITFSL